MTAKDFFYKQIEQYGDAIALTTENREHVTYQELVQRADRFAAQIGRRCLVFLVCKNVTEAVIGYVGCLRNDIVPVMVSADMDEHLFRNLLENYRPMYT